jgi:hypothetical protein
LFLDLPFEQLLLIDEPPEGELVSHGLNVQIPLFRAGQSRFDKEKANRMWREAASDGISGIRAIRMTATPCTPTLSANGCDEIQNAR